MIRALGLVAAVGLWPFAALANDSNSALDAGGIVPVQSSDIAMASEDLLIDSSEIHVVYRFRNLSDQPRRVTVAFPFAKQNIGGDVYLAKPWNAPERIFRFQVWVRGAPVTPQWRIDYFENGQDVTAQAQAAGITPRTVTKWQGHEDVEVRYQAYWTQDYAPREEVVVEHHYIPVHGEAYEWPPDEEMRATYCARPAFRRLVRANPRNFTRFFSQTRYILQSARSWAGPIGEFHLTIRKKEASDLLSLCGFPLRKTGPLTFEMRAKNFVPTRDIDLMRLYLVRTGE